MKRRFIGLTVGRLLFALVAIVIITACGFIVGQAYLEIAVSALSIIVLMYLIEGKWAGCVCGIVFCVLYSIVCYSKGFYGLTVFHVFVALPMYVVSLYTWIKNRHGDTVAVRRLSLKKLALVVAAAAAGFGCAYLILSAAGSSNAIFDALTLSLATFGTLLLSLRYVEQWYFNLASNTTVLILWAVAAAADVSNLGFVIATAIFVASNVMALVEWIRMERAQRNG